MQSAIQTLPIAIMSIMGQMNPRAYQCVPYNTDTKIFKPENDKCFKDKQIKPMSNPGIAMSHHNENCIGS
jgi:hypothetical protein